MRAGLELLHVRADHGDVRPLRHIDVDVDLVRLRLRRQLDWNQRPEEQNRDQKAAGDGEDAEAVADQEAELRSVSALDASHEAFRLFSIDRAKLQEPGRKHRDQRQGDEEGAREREDDDQCERLKHGA